MGNVVEVGAEKLPRTEIGRREAGMGSGAFCDFATFQYYFHFHIGST